MSRTLDRALLEFDKMPTVGGDPIVESDSNADGEWTRWADGTQECRYADGVVGVQTGSTEKTWTYPAGFIDLPKFSGSSVWNDTVGRMVVYKNPTQTATTYAQRSDAGALNAAVSNLVASGRWK